MLHAFNIHGFDTLQSIKHKLGHENILYKLWLWNSSFGLPGTLQHPSLGLKMQLHSKGMFSKGTKGKCKSCWPPSVISPVKPAQLEVEAKWLPMDSSEAQWSKESSHGSFDPGYPGWTWAALRPWRWENSPGIR